MPVISNHKLDARQGGIFADFVNRQGTASDVADVAGGISGALGAAGLATGATGIGLAATPFLEAPCAPGCT
eukprot:COSAG02_NODE_18206_length_954_cov_1.631148_1_plen_71_part_00